MRAAENLAVTETTVQLLRFKVANDVFALPIERVVQIIDRRPMTRVPNVSAAIAGVFNYDGAITPVVDLATKFHLDRGSDSFRGCFVIVSAEHDDEDIAIALLADAVVDVAHVRPSDIESAPAFGIRLRLDYLAGLTKIGSEFTLILNVDRFLTAAELLDLATARESAIEAAEEVHA